MNVISACLHVDAAGAGITDVYGAASNVTLPLGAAVRLELDLRGAPDPATGVLEPYDAAALASGVAACYFALDRDFDPRTEPLLLRTSGIAITSGSGGSGAILSVPIPNTGTAPLISALAGSSAGEFIAEIGALDQEGVTLFAHQFAVTVRNRLYMSGDAPDSVAADPAYCTAAEVRLLAAGIASSAAVAAAASGGYATSGAVTEIVSSGGYATSGEVSALAAPVEVVDSASTSKTFTRIDGGTVYRFTRPLAALTISAMPADTREAVLIFSGGIAVDRTPAVSAMLPVKVWDDDDDYVDGSAALPLSATSSGWQFTADSRVWCSATAGNGDDLEIDAEMRIVSGSMTCVSSGGAYIVTADTLLFETTENVSSGEDTSSSVSSAVVSGLVASSTDGVTWTIVSSAKFPYIYGDRWEGHESIGYGSGSAVSVTSALTTTTPIRVALPASAGIVSMPDFESGETYVMSLQHGIAVGAKYEVQS